MTEIKLNVTSSKGEEVTNPIVIHLLEGEAPKPIDLMPLEIKGDINAVADFLSTRTIKKEDSYIIFNEKDMKIKLVVDEKLPIATTVIGSMEVYNELANFGINSGKRYSLSEIQTLIKLNRFWFNDKDAHMKLVSDLKSFNARVQSEVRIDEDKRANKNNAFTKQVTTDLAADFILRMPIFKGSQASIFRVEICYEVTDSQAHFWFESVEMYELHKEQLFVAFDLHKQAFKQKGYTVISS